MDNYRVVLLQNTSGQNELLIALLSDLGYDSFEEINHNEIKAYITENQFTETSLIKLLNSLPVFENVHFRADKLENKNWNEEWEKNFQPILINDKCIVRAPFHKTEAVEYELVIMPKMAFGTGHHATTEMVLNLMLNMNFKDKKVLDFGCGTGILSLLAEKMGAKSIDANDIEQAAFENTIENASLNECQRINALHGDFYIVPNKEYDIILANVTANSIIENLNQLSSLLNDGGHIILSGILPEQSEKVQKLAHSLNLTKENESQLNNWVALHYSKN